ncbi:MAG: hypothetical protein JWN48_2144 [Myxococcaceae bacterium]|nr:hypothetical protein [Myxococcaceae bacterium]
MFASKGIAEHLARGSLGFGALAAYGLLAPLHPWLSLAMLPLALVALRGCPLCWTIGLLQTVVAALRGRSSAFACTDGSCARSARASADEPKRSGRSTHSVSARSSAPATSVRPRPATSRAEDVRSSGLGGGARGFAVEQLTASAIMERSQEMCSRPRGS